MIRRRGRNALKGREFAQPVRLWWNADHLSRARSDTAGCRVHTLWRQSVHRGRGNSGSAGGTVAARRGVFLWRDTSFDGDGRQRTADGIHVGAGHRALRAPDSGERNRQRSWRPDFSLRPDALELPRRDGLPVAVHGDASDLCRRGPARLVRARALHHRPPGRCGGREPAVPAGNRADSRLLPHSHARCRRPVLRRERPLAGGPHGSVTVVGVAGCVPSRPPPA